MMESYYFVVTAAAARDGVGVNEQGTREEVSGFSPNIASYINTHTNNDRVRT